jgi:hypothetical protein
MGKVNYTLRARNGVVTFKTGRYVESFDIRDLSIYESWERIRFAALTAGITLNEDTVTKLLREVKGLD